MKQLYRLFILTFFLLLGMAHTADAQVTVRGFLKDDETGEELIGAAIAIIGGGTGGAVTNYEGEYVLKVAALPIKIRVSYTGYTTTEIDITTTEPPLIRLKSNAITIGETVVVGQRIDEKQKAAPLTVEKLDAIAIKETAAVSFYNGLGNLKGVDMTTASLGFTVINTRGFNSTSPVRSLQIIDGVDNQAPGLNFSLGNFLGASDLDVNSVDLVVGASSSFYGPNAFNGVISMESKNPFIHKGLGVSLKAGERRLFEGAIRYADAFKNKAGKDAVAFKLNFFGLRAYDWVADNYDPITGVEGNQVFDPLTNPGRSNAVNIYGDEYTTRFTSLADSRAGLNSFTRTGYREIDLVDYNTKNIKTGAALHFRTNPSKDFESPEFIISSNFGTGTTVYQGDNRFSLRGILFFQNRLEFRKKDKYFIRAYSTNEDAGRSYDPYFTALRMQEAAKTNEQWASDYQFWWLRSDQGNVYRNMLSRGYPRDGTPEAQYAWQQQNATWLAEQHRLAGAYADRSNRLVQETRDFYAPGTTRFDSLFNSITSRKNTEGGTRFFDKSALYHMHGEYKFTPSFLKEWVVGGNVRLYRPWSDGTIFSDSLGQRIKNSEFGLYTGVQKDVGNFKLSATVRVDKNINFNLLATPAASIVWIPQENHYLRASFASAIRNPTLTDQYLNLRVGPATLVGNLEGFNRLITLESFNTYRSGLLNPNDLVYLDIPPIRPEKVKTFELGYRATLFQKFYVDAGYYFNIYDDFIGYNIGLTMDFDPVFRLPKFESIEVWRVASNAQQRVTTQGIAIGLNYYFGNYYMVQSNYSWNRLNTAETDPIVPAFNTPEHKYNLGLSGRDIPLGNRTRTMGFNINYKWIDGFIFEGSPQFTGDIPTYSLLDAQVNFTFSRLNSTIKIGAANVLNNQQFQVYGGPRIGRMAYVSLLYNFVKK
jgi:iron complex outermembrane recepter protein